MATAPSERLDVRALVIVGGLALVVRLALYLIDPDALFYSDSGEYLEVPHRFYLPGDRPIGVSVLYKVLLETWHDLRVLVIGQALLGVASAVLSVLVARSAGVRSPYSTGVGVAVALSPTLLVYERTILAESLVVFLTILALALFLSAFNTARFGRAIAAGLVIGSIATVRTNNVVVLVAPLMIALIATGTIRWGTRLGLVAVVCSSALVPIVAYGSLNYVDTAARTGEGTFALTHFDGAVLFARVARWTDCSSPERAPPIRAEVCAAGRAYLESDTDTIVWTPGPVNRALGSVDVATRNLELRDLALETIRRHPAGVARLTFATAWTDLTAVDFRYASRAIDAGYAGVIVERYFGRVAALEDAGDVGSALQDAYRWWVRIRLVAWIAVAVAVVLGCWGRRPTVVAMLGVGGFIVPVVAVGLAAPPLPRYVAPYEVVAFVCAAWVAQQPWVAWYRRQRPRAAEPVDADAAEKHIGAAPFP